jgi:hypothetical protein
MIKIVVGILTVALLAYNDWELLGVLHGYIMGVIQ